MQQAATLPPEELYRQAISALGGAMHRRDYHAAFAMLQEAGETGHADALYELAVRTERFNEDPKNLVHSFNWCLKAAQLGHTKAQRHVANMYHRGHGTPRDTTQARYWRTRAAQPATT